ncbi:MAG: magnesium/cobalt transporter CorA [Capnocytophaga sp.]|nr:magnesium/cobalt transporter CorA [Capnocytophaga sp.]
MSKSVSSKSKKRKKSNKIKKLGLPPGSLVYAGEKEHKALNIDVISYSQTYYEAKKVPSVDEAIACIGDAYCTWINVNGLSQIDEIKKLGDYAGLNNLLLEDILDTEHRPKIEILDDNLLVIIKMLYYNKEQEIVLEHLALVLGEGYIITFQEVEDDDVFDGLRKRLQNEKSPIRKRTSDYLLFGILDAIVDTYFVILDTISEQAEDIEDEIINDPKEGMVMQIQNLKKDAITLRKSIYPAREVVSKLEKSDHRLIKTATSPYFRDLFEHTIHIVETLDTYRDMLWGLTDTYMGSMSNKMNNVMRLLTIISTIFIPLTFIVGLYGMNFEYMPELHYRWAYPVVWMVMIGITVWMIFFFKRKKWM